MDELDTRELGLAARAAVVAQLRALRGRGEPVSPGVRQAAVLLGVSERTLWRALRAPEQQDQPGDGLPADWRERYLGWGGNVAAVWRELERDGGAGCSLREMQRRFARDLTAAERASARGGESARRAHGLYVRWEAEYRNAVWQADHKQLDVLVLAAGARRPRSPWVTWAIDDRSRAVMGWALSLQPTAAEVLAALRAGMLPDPGGGPLCGIPARLRIDHGLEFVAGSVQQACAGLDVEVSLAEPYQPQQKGKVERLHRTLIETFLVGLPHFTGGPRGPNGRLEAPGRPLLLGELVLLFARWVQEYNARPHSALQDRSPVEVFSQDPTPLRPLSSERARTLLVARREARVHRDGIRFHRLRFIAPGLAELVGERVEIAFAPHDDRALEVFWNGRWQCTAVPQETLSVGQQHEVLAARREHADELRRRQRAAARLARARIAPITAEDPTITGTTRLPAEPAPRRLRLIPEAAGRTDLLLEHERARRS